VETIKRQTWAAYGCLAARSKIPCEWDLAYTAYRLHARSLCDVQRRCSCRMHLVALYTHMLCIYLLPLDSALHTQGAHLYMHTGCGRTVFSDDLLHRGGTQGGRFRSAATPRRLLAQPMEHHGLHRRRLRVNIAYSVFMIFSPVT